MGNPGKVKSEVEAMTGLTVVAVNVSVEGVSVPKEDSDKSQSGSAAYTVSEAVDNAAEAAEKWLTRRQTMSYSWLQTM